MALFLSMASIGALSAQGFYQKAATPSTSTYQDGAGLVGIGTIVPVSRLSVFGEGDDNQTSEVDIHNLRNLFNGEETNNPTSFYIHRRGTILPPHRREAHDAYDQDGIDFIVTGYGNTGIGMAAPSAKLHVQAADGNTDLFQVDWFAEKNIPCFIVNYAGTTGIGFTGLDDYDFPIAQLAVMGREAGYPLWVSVKGDIRKPKPNLVVNDKGNVGVGTAAPNAALDVMGNIRTNDNDIYMRQNTDANHGLGWYGTQGTDSKVWNGTTIDGPVLYGFNGGALGANTFGTKTTALRWTNDGKVIIGNVSAPNGYSLYVEKGVIAEKFKCALHNSSDWSDYVFDKNYKLATLTEVESFIKKNKHLPGVPSAHDVVCDGIDMAQMDATLLEER